jgi:uncharacterized protein involved in exopolysaccharide biosynthesis
MNESKHYTEENKLLTEEPDFILGDIWKGLFLRLSKLKSQIPKILLTGIIFATFGAGLVWLKKSTYTGRVNFVIEESKQSSAGLFGALAGQIGMDLSSLSGNSGLLAGDNVLELLKSPTLLKKVLLSPDPEDSTKSLAFVYASSYGYAPSFLKAVGKPEIFTPKKLSTNVDKPNRVEDSLLHIISKRIREKELSVFKPDKKLSLFSLDLTTRNEKLSQIISLRLIEAASNLYIETKTRRLRINVDRLQRKSDSVALLLNRKIFSSASKDLINANPSYINTGVDLEISNRDKSLLGGIYSDLNKSLDMSKTALIQETPTIEIIDKPELPLKKNEWKWYLIVPISFILGVLFTCMLFIFFIPIKKNVGK